MKTLALTLALLAGLAQAQEGRSYTPGAFDRLEVDGLARITLTQGPEDRVFVHGDAKTLERVEVERNGSRLLIHTESNWKFWRKESLQMDVQMREPRAITLSGASDLTASGAIRTPRLSIEVSGAADVRLDAIDTDELRFDVSGAGDGRLAGRTDMLVITLSGTGKIKAEDLKAKAAKVDISGAGGARLWVTDALNVSISGIGDVDYWGKPGKISRDTSGLGSIKALGDKH